LKFFSIAIISTSPGIGQGPYLGPYGLGKKGNQSWQASLWPVQSPVFYGKRFIVASIPSYDGMVKISFLSAQADENRRLILEGSEIRRLSSLSLLLSAFSVGLSVSGRENYFILR
jgi:hypothetical protein